ncbi:hypothetical protein C5167_031147, partial [Papaver somniferum]
MARDTYLEKFRTGLEPFERENSRELLHSGEIPKGIKCINIEEISLWSDELRGEIPTSIGLLPLLTTVQLGQNNLSGELPQILGLHSKYKYFSVGVNVLSGSLPDNLCLGGQLIGIVVQFNYFTGKLPKTFANCL